MKDRLRNQYGDIVDNELEKVLEERQLFVIREIEQFGLKYVTNFMNRVFYSKENYIYVFNHPIDEPDLFVYNYRFSRTNYRHK